MKQQGTQAESRKQQEITATAKTERLGNGKCLMNVPRQVFHLNCIETILNGETSKKTHNSLIKMKKTTSTSEKQKRKTEVVQRSTRKFV